MRLYRRTLSVLYFIGFLLHLADVFDLRLEFSKMDLVWKFWIAYLALFDLFASIGLWKEKRLGDILFIMIAISQLIVYLGFEGIFGNQRALIVFHTVTLVIYFILLTLKKIKLSRANKV